MWPFFLLRNISCFRLLTSCRIDHVDQQVRIPLRQADTEILKLVGKVNNFTISVPYILEDFLNEKQDQITESAIFYLNLGLEAITTEISNIIFDVQSDINSVLAVSSNLSQSADPTLGSKYSTPQYR